MPDYIRTSRAADSLRDIKIAPHFLHRIRTVRALLNAVIPK